MKVNRQDATFIKESRKIKKQICGCLVLQIGQKMVNRTAVNLVIRGQRSESKRGGNDASPRLILCVVLTHVDVSMFYRFKTKTELIRTRRGLNVRKERKPNIE